MPSPILTLLDYIERTLENLNEAIQKRSFRKTRYVFERLTMFSDCLKESLPVDFTETTFVDFDRHMHFIGHFLDKRNFEWIENNFDDIVNRDFPDIKREVYGFVESGKLPEDEFTPLSENVFIVHGRDHKSLRELKVMLGGFGLNPVVLHEKASGGLTLAEKLEKYSEDVGYAFIVLTPDDVGCQRPKLDTHFKERIFQKLKARARQNVIFEMGYFWGLLERKRVCCLLKGKVERPSDIEGIVYIPFEESVNEVREKIKKELEEAGYKNLYPPSVPKPM